jgi:transcriptional regulator with XRE-family HTH domain
MDQPGSPPEPTFGETVRDARRAKGMTQRKLAEVLHIDFTYLSKVENDRGDPPGDETIRGLARELDLPEEALLARAGKVPPAIRELAQTDLEFAVFLRKLPSLSDAERRELYKRVRDKGSR